VKRRQALRYGLLLGTILGCARWLHRPNGTQAAAPAFQLRDRPYDWVFLYWMPYDNNLSRFGPPILDAIAKGIHSQNILVAVQADFLKTPRLSRTILTQDRVETQELTAENSASVEVFTEYLNWAASQFQAKNWAIVFLGHGGRLDEISPDVHAGEDRAKTQWMNIQDIGNVLSQFNEKINSKVEIFFFQNCNKGTFEIHYELCEIANYTLSSQKILGAPNYYYESLFQFLGRTPDINGIRLAEKIVEFERSDMYSSYTATRNHLFPNLGVALDNLIDSILSGDRASLNLEGISKYSYANENFVDLVECLYLLARQSGADLVKYQNFIDTVQRAISYFPNPDRLEMAFQDRKQQELERLSGLGLFVPENRQQLEKYARLSAYADLKLATLFDTIGFESREATLS